jgi:flagellar hook-associated protein 2
LSAVAGITLNLTGTTLSGAPLALTVTRDAAAIKDKVQAFADAYNKVMEFINEQKTYNEDKKSGGLLMGESLLTRVQSSLHSILIPDGWNNGPGAPEIQMLAQIGVNFENDGTLKVDAAALESAISENFDDVKSLFIDETNGLGVLMQSSVYEYTKVDGFIDNTKSSQERIIDDIEDQILRAEERLDTYEANLLKKFAALESLMSGLQAQQSFLAYQTRGSY